MDERAAGGSLGEPRPRATRGLVAALGAAILFNLWLTVQRQQGAQRLRVRRGSDVAWRAARSPSRAVRYRHGTYYRLARELHGATIHMDRPAAELHRWALEGLGEMRVEVGRSALQLGDRRAQPLLAAATYRTRLDGRALHVLLDPKAREYVMAWVGQGRRARILILPLDRFRAAGGRL